nr:unnamed protein product [Callosobruchus chinensis]CAH7748242.1 unnamed protein product [Callosobruchus chinensis]CAH7760348.1 unnamed protein product [Callosobruchus chinensis]CAH7769934.1 unnamed protein product [Callosobruchus chinensis]
MQSKEGQFDSSVTRP